MKIKIDGDSFELDVARAGAAGALTKINPPVASFNIGDVFRIPCNGNIVVIIRAYWAGTNNKPQFVFGGRNFEPLTLYGGREMTARQTMDYLTSLNAKRIGNFNRLTPAMLKRY